MITIEDFIKHAILCTFSLSQMGFSHWCFRMELTYTAATLHTFFFVTHVVCYNVVDRQQVLHHSSAVGLLIDVLTIYKVQRMHFEWVDFADFCTSIGNEFMKYASFTHADWARATSKTRNQIKNRTENVSLMCLIWMWRWMNAAFLITKLAKHGAKANATRTNKQMKRDKKKTHFNCCHYECGGLLNKLKPRLQELWLIELTTQNFNGSVCVHLSKYV